MDIRNIQDKLAESVSCSNSCYQDAHDLCERIKNRPWPFSINADNNSRVKALCERGAKYDLEAEALRVQLVQRVIENFGIADMTVTCVLMDTKRQKRGQAEMLFSEICVFGVSGLAERLHVDHMDASFVIIQKDGVEIGNRSIGIHFNAAPDLRTALGWLIANYGERYYGIEFFDLDKATQMILDTIRSNGTDQDAFFEPYFEAVKRVFGHNGPTCCIVAQTLWKIATRELGEEHEGYSVFF